jgi:hypothetical protein
VENIKYKNSVIISGFVTKNIKEYGDEITFGLSMGKIRKDSDQNVEKNEDGRDIWDNGFVNVRGLKSEINPQPGDRVIVKGKQSFNIFEQDGKMVKRNIVRATSVEPYEKDVKTESYITGYVADNIQTFGKKGIAFGLSFSEKQLDKDKKPLLDENGKEIWENSFLNVKGSVDQLGDLNPKDLVVLKGFKTFDFFIPKDLDEEEAKKDDRDKKRVAKEIFVGLEIVEVKKSNSETSNEETSNSETKEETPTVEKTEKVEKEAVPEININEDDIPF